MCNPPPNLFAPLVVVLGVFIWSAIGPHDRFTWFLEVLPVLIGAPISATYELFEWLVADLTGTAADAFLGTQGDVWDTQKVMAWAVLGAILSLLTLAKIHDRALKRMGALDR